MNDSEDQFAEQIKTWNPAKFLTPEEDVKWEVNPDGSVSITLPSVIAANLIDTLLDWKRVEDDAPQCDGWKRSPTLRAARRESIVYGNTRNSIETLLGRRYIRAMMNRIIDLQRK